jgi:hypothetical protein
VTRFNAAIAWFARIAAGTFYVTEFTRPAWHQTGLLLSMVATEILMSRLVATFALTLLVVSVSHADVYRFVDSKGQVQYTDRPETLPAELLAKLKSQRTDNSALADRVAADLKARDAAAKVQQTSSNAAAEKAKADQATAADKANRCTQARSHYAGLTTTGRVYTVDDKGERSYMDDAQLEKARATAKEQMDTWCN